MSSCTLTIRQDVNNNNNDDDKQPSRNSSTSSTETASISSEVSSDSIDSTEEDKKKKEDENYKRKLDGLIKKRMADITTPVDVISRFLPDVTIFLRTRKVNNRLKLCARS